MRNMFLILFRKYKREPQWASNLSHFNLTAFLIFLSDMTYPEQWFSNLSEHQSHPGGLIKTQIAEFHPQGF